MCIELSDKLSTFFAFQHEGQYFVFNRLSFGYHNSMNLFLHAINFTLSRVRNLLSLHVPDAVLAGYVYDFCIGTDNHQTHRQALHILLQEL